MIHKTLIVLAGPTAIGKTELAIKIAKHFNTEIISADSRQFYKEMEIGTAKPTIEELSQVKHYLVHSHSIGSEFTVGDYETEALQIINSVFEKKDQAVLTGGSGLFIKAVTDGFDDLPKASTELRQQLNDLYNSKGLKPLQDQLQTLDPDYFNEVDVNNPQRLIRALEVCLTTGNPFSSYRKKSSKNRPFKIVKVALEMPRQELYNRINDRVDKMVSVGLIDEVRALIPFRHLNPLKTVGYSEIFDYLDGKTSLQTAVEAIKQNTRRYAKRQLTWFRKDPGYVWFHPADLENILHYIKQKIDSITLERHS